MILSKEQFFEAFADCNKKDLERFYQPLADAMDEFEIDSPQRMSMFLAQCCHESGHFRLVTENLNYSIDGLRKIFPKYFRDVNPANYARKPEKIANRVYGGRMGNGPESSGDGWRFRGRGLIQLTGKNNYVACSEGLETDLLKNPEYLETPEGAARSAAWFWWNNDLNDWADKNDIVTCTRRINGGKIGLAERKELWEHSFEVFVA